MKELKSKELIAYAESFVAFVLPKIDVEEIILFGSVARGEFGKSSDVDLFFNVKERKKEALTKRTLKEELKKFYKSQIAETWRLKSIKSDFQFEVGNLDKWKLKRSIISDGIMLYGKYKEIPGKTKAYVLFNIKAIRDITKRNRVLRKIFGRKEKSYAREGVIKEIKKLSPTCFFVSATESQKMIKLLNVEKVDFSFFEFWSDKV